MVSPELGMDKFGRVQEMLWVDDDEYTGNTDSEDILDHWTYSYDLSSNRISRVQAQANIAQAFAYDGLNRLADFGGWSADATTTVSMADNDSPVGVEVVGDDWTESDAGDGWGGGTNTYLSNTTGDNSQWVYFNPLIPLDGKYFVYVWLPEEATGGAGQVGVQLWKDGVLENLAFMDQSTGAGKWHLMSWVYTGTKTFDCDTDSSWTLKIRNTLSSITTVYADAVRFVRAGSGSDTLVNSTETDDQKDSAVANNDNGDSVVVWMHDDSSDTEIRAQRYDSNGEPNGSELTVAATASHDMTEPDVDIADNGDFVVTWIDTDGSNAKTQLRVYDESAGTFGTVTTAATQGVGELTQPAAAMEGDTGDIVVTWVDSSTAADAEVDYQCYAADLTVGTGGTVPTGTYTTGNQVSPDVGRADDGGFVVVWTDENPTDDRICAQVFTDAGATSGTTFVVASDSGVTAANPAIGMGDGGGYVVAWDSDDGSSDLDVFAQRYTGGSTTTGSEFQVNEYDATADQKTPAVGAKDSGDFVIAWVSDGQDGSGDGVFARIYADGGDIVNGEFQVNTTATNAQNAPAVDMNDSGESAVAWTSDGQDSDGLGVFARSLAADALYGRQTWEQDAVGNWQTFTDDGDAQSNTFNSANEFTVYDGVSGALTYDAAGNMTNVPGSGSTYDAWGRLMTVAGATRYNRYDGLNRRIRRYSPIVGGANDYRYYYDTSWRVLEMNDANAAGTCAGRRNVWGLRYVDDLVVRVEDFDRDGTIEAGDWVAYTCTDANFNVTALVNTDGGVMERFHYGPYGTFTVLNGDDDADSGVADFSVDANGLSDTFNERFFASMIGDTEHNLTGQGFYYARNRYYAGWLGRWISPDPNNRDKPGGGYQDGMNRFEYVKGMPIVATDPMGLTRLEYKYIAIWVSNGRKGHALAKNKAMTKILDNDLKGLLRKYGVNASRTGKGMQRDRMYTWRYYISEPTFWATNRYNLGHLQNRREIAFVGRQARKQYGEADDVMVWVPGYIGDKGRLQKRSRAGHSIIGNAHVVGVSRRVMPGPSGHKAVVLAHEILHHLLEDTISPAPDPYHDEMGFMHKYGGRFGLTYKIGCGTVEALRKKGVTSREIDQKLIIRK